MNTIDIGKIVLDKRKESGLTQQQVADIAFVSRRTLIELEHGRNDIGVRSLLRIVTSLGLQLDVRPRASRPTEDQLREIFREDDD